MPRNKFSFFINTQNLFDSLSPPISPIDIDASDLKKAASGVSAARRTFETMQKFANKNMAKLKEFIFVQQNSKNLCNLEKKITTKPRQLFNTCVDFVMLDSFCSFQQI